MGNLLNALGLGGASAPPQFSNYDALRQMQQSYHDNMQRAIGQQFYTTGTTTTNTATIKIAGAWNYETDSFVVPNRAKGAYRRTVKEGEMRYSDNPLKWLDERVDEMRVVL